MTMLTDQVGLGPRGGAGALADRVDLVVGVDTHTDTHTAAIVDARGGVIATVTVPADPGGFTDLLDAVAAASDGLAGPRIAWAVEGSGSYGAGLRETLQELDQSVVEVTRARRPRGQGKNDVTDAIAIARAALGRDKPGSPRRGMVREALRVLTAKRDTDVAHRTRLINQFKAGVLTAPEPVRARLRGLPTRQALATAARLRGPHQADLRTRTVIDVLKATAGQIAALDAAIAEADTRLDQLTTTYAPALRAEHGVGPVVAATILIAYSHPGRFRSEAAFAALAGVSPLEASSGRVVRHRLNRTGDRALNAALHRIVLTRRRDHPETLDYLTRRRGENKTDREINRCLKRAVARRVFRLLEATPAMP